MYRGKKTFSYLNNPSAPHNETLCHFLKPGDFVVQLDGECKKYLKFASVDAFFFWYSAIPAPLRMFSEVVFEGPQKFRVDVDDKLCTDEIDELVKCIHEVFDKPQIVEYDIKTSHHFVVSNFHLASSRDCYYIAMKLQSLLSPSLESKIDWGVYKSTQNFRLEWSTKYQQKRWKIRTHATLHEDFDVDSFKKGVLGFTQDTQPKLVSYIPSNPTPNAKRIGSEIVGYDPNVFKVRKKIGSMILLDRIKPAYCSVCKRTHDHENAYMITQPSNLSTKLRVPSNLSTNPKRSEGLKVPSKFFCRRATV
jgi:hypothetical protein